MDTGHWQNPLNLKIDVDVMEGFVYTIRNRTNNMMYIGQKRFKRAVTRQPLKGRVNKRRSTTESDWRTYTGSSNRLNQHIQEHGVDNFEYTMIRTCRSKWELNYEETRMIINHDAVPRTDYYNEYIGRVGACPRSSRITP